MASMGGGMRCLRRSRYHILDRAPHKSGPCFAPRLVSLQASFGDRRSAFDRRDRDRCTIYGKKGPAAPSQANVFVLCFGGDFVGDWNLDARFTLNVRKYGHGGSPVRCIVCASNDGFVADFPPLLKLNGCFLLVRLGMTGLYHACAMPHATQYYHRLCRRAGVLVTSLCG
jgi:hypothetical protein